MSKSGASTIVVPKAKHERVSDSDRFRKAMSQVYGHRLTYAELTGKNESPRHSSAGTREAEPF